MEAIDRSSSTSVNNQSDRSVDQGVEAVAAEAARAAAIPLDPVERAIEGYKIASTTNEPNAGAFVQARSDAAANAATILSRTDLGEQGGLVRNVVERLGNAVVDGKIAPNINGELRESLYILATEQPGKDSFNGALAQMTRTAQVLDQFSLEPGTKLAYDPTAGQNLKDANLPRLDVDKVDADIYFKPANDALRLESTKLGANTLASEAKEAVQAQQKGNASQLLRQGEWRQLGTVDQPRQAGFFMLDAKADFTGLMNPKNIAQLEQVIGDPDVRNIVIGDRAYSVNDLKQFGNEAIEAAKPHIEAQKQAWVDEGNPAKKFNMGAAYTEYFKNNMGNPDAAMETLGKTFGERQPVMEPLARADLPSAKQGGMFGAAAAGGITLIRVASDGKISLQDAADIAKSTALGGTVGAVTAQGERLLTPVIDKAIGPSVQRAVESAAAKQMSQEAAVGTGFMARTMAGRLAGSTAVGAVITTGISAYENREGLAKGESQAIGNVAADTAVGAASVAGAVAVGAAVGSVVPVAGTAVGAVVGLAVGVGITYGAQISGARDAIADTVSGWADSVKSWF